MILKRNNMTKTIAFGLAMLITAGYGENGALAASQFNEVKKKQIESQSGTVNNRLSENVHQQDSVIASIKSSDKHIQTINSQITGKRTEIGRSEAARVLLTGRINLLAKRIDERNKLLKERIRSVYINGGAVSYLDVLFGAKSFGNFLDRVIALKMITDHDNQVMADQKRDQKEQVSKQDRLRRELKKMQANLSDLEKLKVNLDQEQKEQQSELALLRDRASKIKVEMMAKSEETDNAKVQSDMIRSQADSPAIPAVQKDSADTRSAGFIRPAEGYITSGFGFRSFDNRLHPGVDIANSIGTPVKAAADGVVFRSYQSSSYGNTVMISHRAGGKLYTTVYAHLSSYNVSAGQSVSQGQLIGKMGSTGESTGSHLHFELYIGPWTPAPHNGSVNPMNYIQ